MNETTTKWTEVLWITLTDRNDKDYLKFASEVSHFLDKLSHVTKCHLLIHRGGDKKNTHSHCIVLVPETELLRFRERRQRFKPWKHWRFRTLDVQDWDHQYGSGAYVYVDNHKDLFPPYVVCPQYFRTCRRGSCPHS